LIIRSKTKDLEGLLQYNSAKYHRDIRYHEIVLRLTAGHKASRSESAEQAVVAASLFYK